jgi:hypothetical protein
MTNHLKDMTDEQVVDQLFTGSIHVPQTPIAQVEAEMQRRLIVAIRDFNTKSGRQANWMIGLTVAIAVLTVAIAWLTGVLVARG